MGQTDCKLPCPESYYLQRWQVVCARVCVWVVPCPVMTVWWDRLPVPVSVVFVTRALVVQHKQSTSHIFYTDLAASVQHRLGQELPRSRAASVKTYLCPPPPQSRATLVQLTWNPPPLTCWVTHWLNCWLSHWLDWIIISMINRLTDCLTH